MGVPVPPIITQPFASAAGPTFITNPIPVPAQPTPGRASFTEGFPEETFDPVVSGGIPPDGRDFNGILYMVTAHCAYVNAGQPYIYSGTVSTAIAGYAKGALLGMSDSTGYWYNNVAGNTADPDANGAGWLPIFAYGHTVKSGLTGGAVTLTLTEAKRKVVVFQGTLTSNLQVIFPNTFQDWLLVNQCTGAFTVTAKTLAGSGVVVPPGSYSSPLGVYGDTINIYPTVAPLNLPISVAALANNIVQRDGNGFGYATYWNQSSGLEVPAIGAVFVQNTAADGFLRKISVANFAAQISLGQFAGQVTNAQVPQSAVTQHAAALFSSPSLTGVPTAPTATPGTNNTQVASTAFVQGAKPKLAAIRMTGGGGTSAALNASGSRVGVGTYVIDVSPAGFTSLPIATASITVPGINADQIYATATSTTSVTVSIRFGGAVDRDFNLIVTGP